MFATGLGMHQIVEFTILIIIIIKIWLSLLVRSKHCDYSVMKVPIII